MGFSNNDMIQLIGDETDYSLAISPQGLPSRTSIFLNDGATPELIGIIVNTSLDNLSLDNTNQFNFV